MKSLLSELKSLAWLWTQRCVHFSYYFYQVYLLEAIKAYPAKSYLEVGCGHGAIVNLLNDANISFENYVGIDSDAQRIQFAQNHYAERDRIQFFHGFAEEVATEQDFECLILIGLLHHISDDDALQFFSRVRKRISGNVLILEPVFDWQTPISMFYRKFEQGKYQRTHAQLMKLLERAGLNISFERRAPQKLRLFEFSALAANFS